MRKRVKKKHVDQQLLNALFRIEREWKQQRAIVEQSIEPSDFNLFFLGVSQAKYMCLIREAKIRKVSAFRYR